MKLYHSLALACLAPLLAAAQPSAWESAFELQQKQNRAKTGKDFPVQEALVACDAELKAADREELARAEADLERRRAALPQAKNKSLMEQDIKYRTAGIEEFRTNGQRSERSLTKQAWFMVGKGDLTVAEIRKELPRYNPKVSSVPARDEATICLLKVRLAQLEAKPSKK